jgi:hypothetical protein
MATGKLDLVVGNFGPEYENTGSLGIAIVWGNGDGTFQTDAVSLLLAGYDPASLVAEDLDGDGRLDLAAANVLSNSVSVLLNRGGGKFAPAVNYSTRYLPSDNYTPLPGLLTAGDFNADGRSDLALATADGIQPLMNTGGGRLHAPASIELRNDPISAAALDLNGDGRLDIAVEVG